MRESVWFLVSKKKKKNYIRCTCKLEMNTLTDGHLVVHLIEAIKNRAILPERNMRSHVSRFFLAAFTEASVVSRIRSALAF